MHKLSQVSYGEPYTCEAHYKKERNKMNKLEFHISRTFALLFQGIALAGFTYFALQHDYVTAGVVVLAFGLFGKLFHKRAEKYKAKMNNV